MKVSAINLFANYTPKKTVQKPSFGIFGTKLDVIEMENGKMPKHKPERRDEIIKGIEAAITKKYKSDYEAALRNDEMIATEIRTGRRLSETNYLERRPDYYKESWDSEIKKPFVDMFEKSPNFLFYLDYQGVLRAQFINQTLEQLDARQRKIIDHMVPPEIKEGAVEISYSKGYDGWRPTITGIARTIDNLTDEDAVYYLQGEFVPDGTTQTLEELKEAYSKSKTG